MFLFIQLVIFLLLINDIHTLAPPTRTSPIQQTLKKKLSISPLDEPTFSLLDEPTLTALNDNIQTPYNKNKLDKPLNQNLFTQLPLSMKNLYDIYGETRLHSSNTKKIKLLIGSFIYFFICSCIFFIGLGLIWGLVNNTILNIVLFSLYILISTTLLCLSGAVIFILYRRIRPVGLVFPQPLFQRLNDIHITPKKVTPLTEDIYLTKKQEENLQSHFKISPVGAYTVLTTHADTYLLFTKVSPHLCLVWEIDPSQVVDFFFVQELVHPYLKKNTLLNPFSIEPHYNLKGQKIMSGSGVGFELEGALFFSPEQSSLVPLPRCECMVLPDRGPTNYPSFYKTVSNPPIGISFDIYDNLELISYPIRYSNPSNRKDTQDVIFHMIETFRGLENQVSSVNKPLSKLLDKVTQDTGIIYEKSQDTNNIFHSQPLYLGLKKKQPKPTIKSLHCTYSIPLETLTSPVLSFHTLNKDYEQAIYKAQTLIQIDLKTFLLERFSSLNVHDLKKLEGFFTALFYVLSVYARYRTEKEIPKYLKFDFNIYIKHNLYDVFTLLPFIFQDFLTNLSRSQNNFLYRAIAHYLQTNLNTQCFLPHWYIQTLLERYPELDKHKEISLHELLDILFQRKEMEKDIWFVDDESLDFVRNNDDFTHTNQRLLVEIRYSPAATQLDNEIKVYMQDFVEVASNLSPYNTAQHLFESVHNAHRRFRLNSLLFKSA